MPRSRSKRRRRSAAELSIRGAAALVAAALGFSSVSATLANVIARADPARAHHLTIGHGHLTAAAAEQIFERAPNSAVESEAAKLSELALRQDPTAVSALSVLGLQAQLRGDGDRARELFSYSQRLSRRELTSQIGAIGEAVARGDIAGALKQYDRALRTSHGARDILFPVLARALAEPQVRERLLDTIASKPSWSESFLRYAATNAPEPRAVHTFFQDASRAGIDIKDDDRNRLVNALVAAGATDEAWRFYESFRPSADRKRSRDPKFALDAEILAVFDWNTLNPEGVSTSIQQGQNGGVVHFSAASGAGGAILRQMQLLPPGGYQLKGRSLGIEQPRYSQPYWVLTCHDGRELGRVLLPKSGDKWEHFTGRFTVPSKCAVQTLSLVVRASEHVAGVQGRVDTAQLVPTS